MVTWLSDVGGDFYGPQTQHLARVFIALLLGGLVGLERELRDKPAGFRTIILICVGACVFTLLSQATTGPTADSGRIAAQVVTGVGFLGAGAIIQGGGSVYGMTTAATIWAVAAIGMAVGFGHMALAAVGTVAILLTLFMFDLIETWIGDLRDIQEYGVKAPTAAGAADRIDAMFKEAGLRTVKRSYHQEGRSLLFQVRAMGSKGNHERMRRTIVESEEFTLTRP